MTQTIVLTPDSADASPYRKFYGTYSAGYSNYKWKNEYGQDPSTDVFRVGYDYDGSTHQGKSWRSAVNFARGGLPIQSIVTEARLRLYCGWLWLQNVNYKPTVRVYRCLQSWSHRNASWSLSHSPSATGEFAVAKANRWYEVDVRDDVAHFLATGDWLGWFLQAKNELPSGNAYFSHTCRATFCGKEYANASLRPQLVVTYETEKTPIAPSLERRVAAVPTFFIEGLKTGFHKLSSLRVSLNYGRGVPTFRAQLPDPGGKLKRKFRPLDACKIWAWDQGQMRLLMRGVALGVASIFERRGRTLEVEGANYTFYLLVRQKNEDYGEKELSEIVKDLAKLAPEVEAKYYVLPTARSVAFSAYDSIFENIVDLARIAGGDYAAYVCEGIHPLEEGKPNLHFHPIYTSLNRVGLDARDCLELVDARLKPRATKVYVTYRDGYELKRLVLEYADAELNIEASLFDKYARSEDEAYKYGEGRLKRWAVERGRVEALVPGDLRYEPGKLLRFTDEGGETRLYRLVEVEHDFAEGRFTTRLRLEEAGEAAGEIKKVRTEKDDESARISSLARRAWTLSR